jgi:hypothetical protein
LHFHETRDSEIAIARNLSMHNGYMQTINQFNHPPADNSNIDNFADNTFGVHRIKLNARYFSFCTFIDSCAGWVQVLHCSTGNIKALQ